MMGKWKEERERERKFAIKAEYNNNNNKDDDELTLDVWPRVDPGGPQYEADEPRQ